MKADVKLVGLTMPADTVALPPELWDKTVPGLREPLDIVEYAGRWDYGERSLLKMGDRGIIRRWLNAGEESMLEMVDVHLLWTCSRVVSHELVRHRMASYQQESQRFVAYEDEDFEELMYFPPEWEGNLEADHAFQAAYQVALMQYQKLRDLGVPKQMARYVLPNATRTRLNVKANLRSWRHILKLRLHTSAQPEMRELAGQSRFILNTLFPEVFDDVDGSERAAR